MSCFTKKEVNNPKFPRLSREVAELKSTDGRVSAMSEIMEELLAIGREEGRKEGRKEGREEGRLFMRQQLIELVTEGLLKVTDAAKRSGMTEDEFKLLLKK